MIRRSACALLVASMFVGLVGAQSAFAAGKKKDPGVCSLTQSATGDLVAAGGGFMSSTMYQYEVYSAPRASVGGGEFTTDASGNLSADLGPSSFLMNVYPGETTLTFDVYPIIGGKADLSIVDATCSIPLS